MSRTATSGVHLAKNSLSQNFLQAQTYSHDQTFVFTYRVQKVNNAGQKLKPLDPIISWCCENTRHQPLALMKVIKQSFYNTAMKLCVAQ